MNKIARLVVVSCVILVLSLSLLFLTVNNNLQIPYISSAIHTSLSAFNNVLAKPTQFFSEQKDAISDMIAAYNENKDLKKQVIDLENQLLEQDTLAKENESLRQTLSLAESYENKFSIAALVSSRTPTSWANQLTLSVGEEDGITDNMVVMANGGLIGLVTAVYSHSTDVKLLSSSDEFIKIPVKISLDSTTIYGILAAYDTDTTSFVINQLNSTDTIPEGAIVVTSDLAGNIPSNIQIGTVSSIRTNASDLSRELYVKPMANFSNIYSVLVVGEE